MTLQRSGSEFVWLCLIGVGRLCDDTYHLGLRAAAYITSCVKLILNNATPCYRNNKEQALMTNTH